MYVIRNTSIIGDRQSTRATVYNGKTTAATMGPFINSEKLGQKEGAISV